MDLKLILFLFQGSLTSYFFCNNHEIYCYRCVISSKLGRNKLFTLIFVKEYIINNYLNENKLFINMRR